MKQEQFNIIVKDTIKQIEETLESKNAEYAMQDDKFFNFRTAARINDCTMEEALWGMNSKHLVSTMDFVTGRVEPTIDLVDEKIGDFINYLIILKAMLYLRCLSKIKGDENV